MKSLGRYSLWGFLCFLSGEGGTVISCKLGLTTLQDTLIEIHCIEHKAYEVQSCRILIPVLYITVLSNRSPNRNN